MLIPVAEPPRLLMLMSPLTPVVLIWTEPSLLPPSVKSTPAPMLPIGAVPSRVIVPVEEVILMGLIFPVLDMPDEFTLVVVPVRVMPPVDDWTLTFPELSWIPSPALF